MRDTYIIIQILQATIEKNYKQRSSTFLICNPRTIQNEHLYFTIFTHANFSTKFEETLQY
jgi:hypothetical protein